MRRYCLTPDKKDRGSRLTGLHLLPCKLVEIDSHAGQFRVNGSVDRWNRGGEGGGKRSDTQPARRWHAHEGGFPLQASPFLTVDLTPIVSLRTVSGGLWAFHVFSLGVVPSCLSFLAPQASRLSEAKTWLAASRHEKGSECPLSLPGEWDNGTHPLQVLQTLFEPMGFRFGNAQFFGAVSDAQSFSKEFLELFRLCVFSS